MGRHRFNAICSGDRSEARSPPIHEVNRFRICEQVNPPVFVLISRGFGDRFFYYQPPNRREKLREILAVNRAWRQFPNSFLAQLQSLLSFISFLLSRISRKAPAKLFAAADQTAEACLGR